MMTNIIKDASLGDDRFIGIIDVQYPAQEEWDVEAFEALKASELAEIMAGAETYSRDEQFRNQNYFRYFRKFKKTYPVMMQVESVLLKGRPFPEGEYINAVAFLTELKTHVLLGTHDVDRIEGDCVFYSDTEKTPFHGMFHPDVHTYPGDITGRDDKDIIISMISGADAKTCIHEDTNHVIYIIFGVPGQDPAEFEPVADQVVKYVTTLAPSAVISRAVY